jgi:hypothetical protein
MLRVGKRGREMFRWLGRILRGLSREQARLVARYQELRELEGELNPKLGDMVGKSILHEGGKKLGLLRRGVLEFESEQQFAVLMDYCIYDIRRKGLNAVERYPCSWWSAASEESGSTAGIC